LLSSLVVHDAYVHVIVKYTIIKEAYVNNKKILIIIAYYLNWKMIIINFPLKKYSKKFMNLNPEKKVLF